MFDCPTRINVWTVPVSAREVAVTDADTSPANTIMGTAMLREVLMLLSPILGSWC
jgi:hypothetical protein